MRVLIAVALAFLVAPVASGEPFLQSGHDAARTGNPSGPGPNEYEVAMDLELPGARAGRAPPLLINGSVYALLYAATPAATGEPTSDGLTETGLFRIDLATAAAENLIPLDAPASTFASDGQRFYIAESDKLSAYSIDGSGPHWTWNWPVLGDLEGAKTWCGPPAIEGETLFLVCTQEYTDDTLLVGDPEMTTLRAATLNYAFLARVNMTDGAVDLVWDSTIPESLDTTQNPESDSLGTRCQGTVSQLRVHSVAVLGSHVLVVASREPDYGRSEDGVQFMLIEFDRETGDRGWMRCAPNWVVNNSLYIAGEDYAPVAPVVTGTADHGFLVHDDLEMISVETGEVEEWKGVGNTGGGLGDFGPANYGTGIARRGDSLYVLAYQKVFQYDIRSSQFGWSHNMDSGLVNTLGPLIGGDAVFVPSYTGVAAHDAHTGAFLWKHSKDIPTSTIVAFPATTIALEGRVLASLTSMGHLTVLGRTEVSIQPVVEAEDSWPSTGDPVRLDLSKTAPGLADDLEFQVEWGDGTVDDWQPDGGFEHVYDSPGRTEVRIAARNGAGQRSVETIVLDVGGTPPEELNFFQEAFAPGNQDLTFGVLGIAVALGGGIIALGWRHTKRSRLQHELDAIERAYETTKDDPQQCEAALLERKARCRGLLLDGKIEEPQFAVLENRIHELTRTLRVTALDDRFDFLPHGLVKALRDMLSDGRISAWEREHVVRALQEDKILTNRQKQKVQGLVDQWFERDAGRMEVDQ